jgi:mannose-1-phosphate guanylyltransferase / mannose-6-phosphate isomerase
MPIPVILSGGAGSRLWPVSREGHPKPFMKLADGESLLEKTYRRARLISPEIITVTNRDYYFMSRDEMELAGCEGRFILEPQGRNTAPAIAVAACIVAKTVSPDQTMLVLAADHLIQDAKAFLSTVKLANQAAEQDKLVTFGIVPTAPETGFGYIECGEQVDGISKVRRFVEKPDLADAKSMLATGRFLWNSGMFCFKAGVFLEELNKYAPKVASAAYQCVDQMLAQAKGSMLEVPAEEFAAAPDISVDYAVMEHSDRVAVVPADIGWSDIGSWNAVRDLAPTDSNMNRAIGEAIFVDSHQTFIQSEDRLVAAVGVQNLMIIDTPDALLVAHPDKAQDVKQVVAQLKKSDHDTFKLHRTVMRPWGTYTVLQECKNFKIKRIEVKPGASLSLQMHYHRSEHWIVVSGCALVTNGESEIQVLPNQSTYIPAGQKHRLTNPGTTPCVLIEVQCGTYLGEDDIVRYQDTYGRQ